MMFDDRFSFIVEWYDKMSGYTNKYMFVFYTGDSSIEMYDMKNRKTFLKRTIVPDISIDDLYIGGNVAVNSRALTIVEYGDTNTKDKFSSKHERVVGIVEPRANMGDVLNELKREHLTLTQLRFVRLHSSEVATLRKVGGNSYSGLKEGLNMALEAQGTNSRKKWGWITKDYNDLVGSSTAAIGSADNSDDANIHQESKLLFSKREPCAYFTHCTLCLIKPHAVKEGFTGEIINAILEEGFNITAMEMIRLSEAQATDFFIVYKDVLPEYNDFVAEMSTGPCVAMEIREEGGKVTGNFREFCGPHDPDLARSLRPNTLRALFGKDKVKNAVHCTDLPEDSMEEVVYFLQ